MICHDSLDHLFDVLFDVLFDKPGGRSSSLSFDWSLRVFQTDETNVQKAGSTFQDNLPVKSGSGELEETLAAKVSFSDELLIGKD